MSLFETTEVLVFFNVLLQQLGVPVPAVPTLILSASLAGQWSGIFLLALVATLASLIADWAWWPWSLVVAKFIPGFSTVAPPIAGAVKMSILSFTIASATGAFLWAMAALLAGWLFKEQVNAVYAALQNNLFIVGIVAALICAFWLMWKLARQCRKRPGRSPCLAQNRCNRHPVCLSRRRQRSACGWPFAQARLQASQGHGRWLRGLAGQQTTELNASKPLAQQSPSNSIQIPVTFVAC